MRETRGDKGETKRRQGREKGEKMGRQGRQVGDKGKDKGRERRQPQLFGRPREAHSLGRHFYRVVRDWVYIAQLYGNSCGLGVNEILSAVYYINFGII